jgi:hypothetical protein
MHRPVNGFELYTVELLRMAKGKMPRQPRILYMIIETLLRRTERNAPDEGRFLRAQIQLITGMEALFEQTKLDEEVQKRKYQEVLNRILGSPVPKADHLNNVIPWQRDLLVQYLLSNPLPKAARVPADLNQWLQCHLAKLWPSLCGFPCLCLYSDLPEINALTEKMESVGSTHLVHNLLAHLHNSTHRNIEKFIRAASSRR